MDSKKSFILYADYLEHVELLSNEDKGLLFDAILKHVNSIDVKLGGSAKLAFSFIKLQLDRDNDKYEKFIEKQRSNGKKGGRPKGNPTVNNDNPNNPRVNWQTQKSLTDTVTVTVTDTDNDIEEEKSTKKEMVLADAKPKIKPKQIKGTRFDEKVTTEEWEIFARDNLGWDKERTQATFNEFNDYWIGVAGAKGVKLDWLATWRNWCRRANEKPYRNNSQIRERGLTAHEKQLEATRNVIARGRSRDSLSE